MVSSDVKRLRNIFPSSHVGFKMFYVLGMSRSRLKLVNTLTAHNLSPKLAHNIIQKLLSIMIIFAHKLNIFKKFAKFSF